MSERKAGRRAGIGMLVLCWIVMLALAMLWFRDLEQHRQDPNADLASLTVDHQPVQLKRNAYGHFVAPGEVDGHAVTFLIDTGATYVSLSRNLADALKLELGPEVTFTTANGRVSGQLTTLDSVTLGGLRSRHVPGSIHDGFDDDTVLLGMSFLGRYDIRIRGDEMVVAPATR